VHAQLAAEPERVTETVRAAALDVDAGSVWVERVTVHTEALRSVPHDWPRQAGPLGDLAREIAALKADPAALEAFIGGLSGLTELTRKVRPLASSAEPSLRAVESVLDDAHELLVARLTELGG
jgi:hypothetical protein